MSFVGAIKVILKVRDQKVIDVQVAPKKELHIENLFMGKTIQEAKKIIEPLFALCPDSQMGAFQLSTELAKNGLPNQGLIDRVMLLNHLEVINEGVRFFALQLSNEQYRADKIPQVIKVREIIQHLKNQEVGLKPATRAIWAELRSAVSFLLLDGLSKDWEQDFLNGTISPKVGSIGEIFVTMDSLRALGWNSSPLLLKPSQAFLQELYENKCWSQVPWSVKVPYITGPVSRMKDHKLVRGLLNQDGNTAYTRLVARFVELIVAADRLRSFENATAALEIMPSGAVSLIQNSRGVLLHSVKLTGDVIENYHILTPTEINVTLSEAFYNSLKGLYADSEEELKKLANFIIYSYDPCTQIDVEVKNA